MATLDTTYLVLFKNGAYNLSTGVFSPRLNNLSQCIQLDYSIPTDQTKNVIISILKDIYEDNYDKLMSWLGSCFHSKAKPHTLYIQDINDTNCDSAIFQILLKCIPEYCTYYPPSWSKLARDYANGIIGLLEHCDTPISVYLHGCLEIYSHYHDDATIHVRVRPYKFRDSYLFDDDEYKMAFIYILLDYAHMTFLDK